jgi:hypothetical protein
MENSWAGIFRIYLFEKLPVERLKPHFDMSMGRPTKELYVMVGAVGLQQMLDLSDKELQEAIAFNTLFHYALDITDHSDESGYVCEKTLWTYRQIIIDEGLDIIMFEHLTDELANAFDVDTSTQRIDSTHIQSNMRKLGRVRIFAETIRKFLRNLKRQYIDLFDSQIEERFREQYLDEKKFGCFSQVKPSEAAATLQELSKDLLYLVEQFKDNDAVCRLNSYQLLERVLKEHCTITWSDDDDPDIKLKAPKEVPSDSLQNPSDPDAGYSPHKGKGYSAQIMETYSKQENNSEEERELQLDLITYADATPAHVRDSEAVQKAIENTGSRGCKPEELDADSAYGGDENVQKASDHDVELVAPVHCTDGQKGFGIKHFECDTETGTVTACPQGHTAIDTYRTAKGRLVSRFGHTLCKKCPHRHQCPVTIRKTSASLYYTDKQVRLAIRRQYEETEEFRDRYRWRAGIEATNSRLKSQTGAGRLRYRGLEKVRFAVKLKALGINILRAARVHAARNRSISRSQSVSYAFLRLFSIYGLNILLQVKNILSKNIFGTFSPFPAY